MSSNFYEILFEDLNPKNIQRKFLELLLQQVGVKRGSIWIEENDKYICIEADGQHSEQIKGLSINANEPSIVGWVIKNGKMTVAEAGQDPRHYKDIEEAFKIKSKIILCFPLILKGGKVYGAVQIIDTSEGGNIDDKHMRMLQSLVDIGSIALSNALFYIKKQNNNPHLKSDIEELNLAIPIIGQNIAFVNTMKEVRSYSRKDYPVLIIGETGTGKELVANEIHKHSLRKNKPFIPINCSTIPSTLMESELFGYKKGSFTGAGKDKIGIFEAANEGTVFLDEIGDMPLEIQAGLLRVIQNSEIKPLGDTKAKKINVRIISATNKDLKKEVLLKNFRADLFYRLNVLYLNLPSLRERKDDILFLLDYFVIRESLDQERSKPNFSKESLNFIVNYRWDGNIRELENFVKRLLTLVDSDIITIEHLPEYMKKNNNNFISVKNENTEKIVNTFYDSTNKYFEGHTLDAIEIDYLKYLLEKNKWNITLAAKQAGINRATFHYKIKKLGIK